LSIRRALGNAALQLVVDAPSTARKLAAELKKKFTSLILSTLKKAAFVEIESIVNLAIELRTEMTRELAIYRCNWFSTKDEVQQKAEFEEFDGAALGKTTLSLCVFPGFVREMKRDGDSKVKQVCVTKTKVEIK
jgi:hypothetical protein